MATVDSLKIQIKVQDASSVSKDINNISNSTKTATKNANDFSKAIKGTVLASAGLNSVPMLLNTIKRAFGESLEASANFTEVLNKTNVAFGESTGSVVKFAQKLQDTMGINMEEFLNYDSTFGSLLKGMKVTEKESVLMSQNLTQLAYDYASLYNTDVSTSFNKLKSAMSGQVKGLKDYGNNVSVAQVNQTLMSMGINATVSKLDSASQAYARYITLMNNSKVTGVWNDTARTINTTANQLRIFDALIEQIKRNFGAIAEVIMKAVLPYINFILMAIVKLGNAIAGMLGMDVNSKIKDLVSPLKSGTEDASKNTKGISSGLDKAKKKAKEFKKTLQGFDEINQLGSYSDSSSSSSSSGSSGSSGIVDMSGFDWSKYLPSYDFLEGLNTRFAEIGETIKKWIPLLELTAMLMAGIFVGTNIASWIALMSTCVAEFGLLEGIALGLDEIFGGYAFTTIVTTLQGMASATGLTVAGFTAIAAVVAACVVALVQFYDETEWFRDLVAKVVKDTWDLLVSIYNVVFTPIFGFLVGIWSEIEKPLKLFWGYFKSFIGGVATIVLGVWDTISLVLQIVINIIDVRLTNVFYALGKVIGIVAKGILTVLSPVLAFMGKLLTAVYTKFLQPLNNWLRDMAKNTTGAVNTVKNALKGMKDAVSTVKNFIKSAFDYINKNAIKPLGEAFSKLWSNYIKPAINSMLGGFEKFANGGIKAVNELLKPLVGLGNGALKMLGIKDFKFSVIKEIKIPRLASGGFVEPTRGQLINVNENGSELVGNYGGGTLVANNMQVMDMIAIAMAEAWSKMNENGNNRNQNVNITVDNKLDGKSIGKSVIKYHNGVVMQTGRSPLKV